MPEALISTFTMLGINTAAISPRKIELILIYHKDHLMTRYIQRRHWIATLRVFFYNILVAAFQPSSLTSPR